MSLEDGDTLDVDTTDYNIPDIPNWYRHNWYSRTLYLQCNKDNLMRFLYTALYVVIAS